MAFLLGARRGQQHQPSYTRIQRLLGESGKTCAGLQGGFHQIGSGDTVERWRPGRGVVEIEEYVAPRAGRRTDLLTGGAEVLGDATARGAGAAEDENGLHGIKPSGISSDDPWENVDDPFVIV
jgi:hypothetical protein